MRVTKNPTDRRRVVVIGAGIGGLAAALRLAHAGCEVTVLEARAAPGGKIRTLPSAAGPVDAGPTVLTLRGVFDRLFSDVGSALEDHVTLLPLATLARHYWEDGATLDLMADPEASAANVAAAFGPRAEGEFRAFSARAARLFDAFDAPMMQAAAPTQAALAAAVLRRPALLRDMAPHRSLAGLLRSSFGDPRLRQLFGRYATYVGGSPYASPALLALVWQAEARGVWAVAGGMHRLAEAVAALAQARGAVLRYGCAARRIVQQGGRVTAVETATERLPAEAVVFNGDPRALAGGLLGEGTRRAVAPDAVAPRSLSAYVHAFAAQVSGPALSHHTVFFGADPRAEFDALARGERPVGATLYICAQDRAAAARQDGAAAALQEPPGPAERFEIILNGPPLPPETRPEGRKAGLSRAATPLRDEDATKDRLQCQTEIFQRLATFGLRFDPIGSRPAAEPGADRRPTKGPPGTAAPAQAPALARGAARGPVRAGGPPPPVPSLPPTGVPTPPLPGPETLTTPAEFATLFPGSLGSLYGRSPQGLTAGLKRPQARTPVAGLYLAGGGAHPGAGVPMAALSAAHAAEAILSDLASRSTSPRTATPGGMSTGFPTTARGPFRSSGS